MHKKRDLTQLNITRLFILSVVFYVGSAFGYVKEQLNNAGSLTLGAAISLIQQGSKEEEEEEEEDDNNISMW